MPLVKVKPTSPGRRAVVKVVTPGLHKGAPYWSLTAKQSKTNGRNNQGRITMRHKGGGHKQHYRLVDFRRDKDGIAARVERLEYDPNRSALLALLLYADRQRRPLGGLGRAASRARGLVCAVAPSLGRDPQGTPRLPRDHRRGGQRGAQPGVDRKGRPAALARRAPDGARRGDESDRPPARRRRGTHRGGRAAPIALGRAEQGLQDAAQQAHAGDDRSRPPPRLEGIGTWHVRSRRDRSSIT